MINLPQAYLDNIKELIPEDFERFIKSYEVPPVKGIRFNQKKARPDTIRLLAEEWNLEPVRWCETGFYYENVRPGLSPYHDAGLFYIQEPSAMSVVEAANIGAFDTVLDLCAAPGGKSTAAAERCYALLSNEIIPNRARILSSNMERMGYTNTVVSQTSPDRLSALFPGYFDVVLCDAPCSGEGMMRKDPTAITEWSEANVQLCVNRQSEILAHASQMVRPGGKLVYSTCTFEKGENEEQVGQFLNTHKDFQIIYMHRIWPHIDRGEGHFICVLSNGPETPSMQKDRSDVEMSLTSIEKRLSSSGVHILRTGLQKGEYFTDKKGRKVYEPSHAEIMSSVFETCENGINLRRIESALSFLSGNVLRLSEEEAEVKGEEGFCGLYYDGYPLGLGKRSGDTVKNHLPKGLRRV